MIRVDFDRDQGLKPSVLVKERNTSLKSPSEESFGGDCESSGEVDLEESPEAERAERTKPKVCALSQRPHLV